MRTILDFKKAGEKLGKAWMSVYLRVGCPYRDLSRYILWNIGVQSEGLNDALSLLGIPVLAVGAFWLPFKVHTLLGLSHPLVWAVGLELAIILLGYGPLEGVGERLHGDPFGPDGYFTKAALEKTKKDAEKRAKKAAKKAAEAAAKENE